MASSTGPVFPPGLNIDVTLGALLIGTYISVALFGCTALQGYNYFLSFPDDHWTKKALVTWVLLLETVHMILVSRTYYQMGVSNFGTFGDFDVLPSALKISIIFHVFIEGTVQAYFADRIRIVSRRNELPLLCWTLCLFRLALGILNMVKDFEIPSNTEFNRRWKWAVTAILIVGAVNDLLIAGGLSYVLKKSRSGMRISDSIVNTLAIVTIHNGLLTSLLALTEVICYLVVPNNFIWLALFVMTTRTYSNMFLATLNARITLRSRLHKSNQGALPSAANNNPFNAAAPTGIESLIAYSNESASMSPRASDLARGPGNPIAIEMSRVTHYKSDYDYKFDDKARVVHQV